jgi:hypothetical protein
MDKENHYLYFMDRETFAPHLFQPNQWKDNPLDDLMAF